MLYDFIKSNPRLARLLFLVGVVLVPLLVGLSLASLFTSTENIVSDIDDNPTQTDIAIINNYDPVIEVIGRQNEYLLLSKDIYTFATLTNEEYDKEPFVTFVVEGVEKVNDSTSKIFGHLQGVDDSQTTITVKGLPNEQIKTSIVGNNGNSVDTALPSAGKESVYRATLPYEGQGYTIDYIPSENTYYVQQEVDDEKVINVAISEIEKNIGRTIYAALEVFVVPVPFSRDFR